MLQTRRSQRTIGDINPTTSAGVPIPPPPLECLNERGKVLAAQKAALVAEKAATLAAEKLALGAQQTAKKRKKIQRVHKLTGMDKSLAVDKFLTSKGAICLDRGNMKELLRQLTPCCEDGSHAKVIFDIPGFSSMHRACSLCTALIKPADEEEQHRIPKTTIFCQQAMKNVHPLILRTEALLFLCDKQRWVPLNVDEEVVETANPLSCWDLLHLPRDKGLDLVRNGVAPYRHQPWGPSRL